MKLIHNIIRMIGKVFPKCSPNYILPNNKFSVTFLSKITKNTISTKIFQTVNIIIRVYDLESVEKIKTVDV